MVKKAKGGKKGKKKDKKKKPEDDNALTEVDKEFYELQITDLNRKLARLRSRCAELELSNEELNKQMGKLDEDRADVVSYLNRTLQEKEALIEELQDRIQGLIELREQETTAFRGKIDEMEKEFRAMQLQLSSEVKLLGGKLNALDEFRVQRDELMEKFAKQENMMEEQEKRHARELYLVERKFIIAKDRLKKEMENRLLRLSTDFQNATEARIASTTHRVIRENIAINNELDLMMNATRELAEENEKMRKKDQELALSVELHEREKLMAVRRTETQKKFIDRLSVEHAKMSERVKELNHHQALADERRKQLADAEEKHHAACAEARLLRQDLAKCSSDNEQAVCRVDTMRAYVNRMEAHMGAAVKAIKQTLQIEDQTDIDEADRVAIRDNLLCVLLEILSQYDYCNLDPPPNESGSMTTYQLSLGGCSGTYENGDLGLVPRRKSHHQVV